MKIIIDIPENDYKLACNYPEVLIDCYARYIKNGTPLPEKHGRLIDADELMNESQKDEAYGYVDTKQIYDAPTVIEAEDEE